jgi:hypothetical protein
MFGAVGSTWPFSLFGSDVLERESDARFEIIGLRETWVDVRWEMAGRRWPRVRDNVSFWCD